MNKSRSQFYMNVTLAIGKLMTYNNISVIPLPQL